MSGSYIDIAIQEGREDKKRKMSESDGFKGAIAAANKAAMTYDRGTEEEFKMLKWVFDGVDDIDNNIKFILYMSCPDNWQERLTEVQANVMRHIFGTPFWEQFIQSAIETRASPLKNVRMGLGMALQEKKAKIVAIVEENPTKDLQCNASAKIIVDAGNYNMIKYWNEKQWPLETNKLMMRTPPSELQLEYIGNLVFLVEKTKDQSGHRLIKIWGLIESPDLQYAACLLIECKTGLENQTQWTLTNFFYSSPGWYFELAKKRKNARTLAGIGMEVVKTALNDGDSIHVGSDEWQSRMGGHKTDVTSETLKKTAKDILHYEYVEKRYKQLYPNKSVPRADYLNQTMKDGFYAPWLHGITKKEDFRITNANFNN